MALLRFFAAAIFAAPLIALAQAWPAKPIRLVVPYPPGGSTDLLARSALDAAGVPCAPVQNVAQMLGHEQLRALGLLQPVPGSSVPLIGIPVSFDGERPLPSSASPALGAHTVAVLGP